MEKMVDSQKARMIIEVTPEDERVCDLAKRLRHKPETLVTRIKRSLPAPLEQNLYVLMALECEKTILPKTFANILRYYTNGQELTAADLEDRKIGQNLISNKVSALGDYLEVALSLMEKLGSLDLSTPISSGTAARLAKAYGENAADILWIIDSELQYIMNELGWRMWPMVAMTKIINSVARHAADGDGKSERPNILCADDIIELFL